VAAGSEGSLSAAPDRARSLGAGAENRVSYCCRDIDLRKASGMAAQKRPAQQSVNISTVSSKEIMLIVLAMVVLAGAAISFTLLG
jgi:hypothetical protein